MAAADTVRCAAVFSLFLTCAVWAAPVFGGYLPAPPPVPSGVSAQCAAVLDGQRVGLVDAHQGHENTIARHESRCTVISEDDIARIEECFTSRQVIEIGAQDYLDAIDAFARLCSQARQAARAQSEAANLAGQLAQAEQKAVSARREMERITNRMQNYRVQIEEWTELSLAARQAAIDTATSATIDAVVNRMLKLGEEVSVDAFAKAMQRMDRVRRKLALRNPERFAALLKTAHERAQGLGKTATLMVLAQMVKNGVGDYYAVDAVQHGKDREEVLEGLLHLTTSAAGVVMPAAPYVAGNAKTLAALAGGWHSYFVAKKNVLKLLELSEMDARLVTSATARYLEHTDFRLGLKAEYQAARAVLDIAPPAPPGCP